MTNVTHLQEHAVWTKAGPVAIHGLKTDISALEERAVATIADPAPLGLWAFATGTWMAGTVLGGAFASTTLPAMAPVLLIFAGLAQFIAGLYAFRRANSLAATAFCCFGSFNITAAAMFMLSAAHITPAGWDTPIFMGFLLESFAFIALALSFAALRRNAVLVLVLLTLAIGYCLTGIPNLALSVDQGGFGLVGHIGGWFLVASAALAYYGGMAIVVNSNWRRAVLPLGGEP